LALIPLASRRNRPKKEKIMSAIETRLAELGVTLPDAPAPAANYVPFVQSGSLVHVSGQISGNGDGLITGKLGADLDVAAGADAARACAISLLAQLKKACGGDIDRLVRVVKLVGFVNSTPDFTDQPKVINGASDFMVAALGDKGRHARSAVSAASLPFGVAVEIEAVFEIA
jgi:enamine deaminase RidA (YjgF/YER057c/UK114 family)